jgi:hypothetical protein
MFSINNVTVLRIEYSKPQKNTEKKQTGKKKQGIKQGKGNRSKLPENS